MVSSSRGPAFAPPARMSNMRVPLVSFALLVGSPLAACVPAAGDQDRPGEWYSQTGTESYPPIDPQEKDFKPGPILATPDQEELARRFDYHRKVIEAHGFSYHVDDIPVVHSLEEHLTGLKRPSDMGGSKPTSLPVPKVMSLPQKWDWRAVGAGLPPARNQSHCGSCWAFGTIAAVEGAIAAFDKQIVDLSEQFVVDCNHDGYGCGGGYWAYDLLLSPGSALEKDYPYKAYDQSCKGSNVSHPYKIEEYHGLPSHDIDAIKAAIYQYGTVGVTMNVCGSIPGFGGGIYDSNECNWTASNHIVALVGWDDTIQHKKGKGVWVLRNSWGTSWGDDGYGLFAYGTAGLEDDATYVVYKPVDNTDTDGDTVPDWRDNCKTSQNADQADQDEDGKGDACDGAFDPFEKAITLSDDDSRKIDLHFQFPFYGTSYTQANVNSDGNLTFGATDGQSGTQRSKARFLSGPPRIAPMFADLNPAAGGKVSWGKATPDSAFVKYDQVRLYGSSGSASATVTLRATGDVEFAYGAVAGSTFVAGLSRGATTTTPPDTDLSAQTQPLPFGAGDAVCEAFSTSRPFDLAGRSLTFLAGDEPSPLQDAGPAPDGGPGADGSSPPPPSPTETAIPLGDDDTRSIPLGFAFPFYDHTYTEVHVNSDGNLTFGAGDGKAANRSVDRFLTGAPRIAALFADLNPAAGGLVSYRHDDPQSITITYKGVPTYGSSVGNTATVTLDSSGRITLTYGGISGGSSVVGLSQGGAANSGSPSDLSAAPSGISFGSTTAVYQAFGSSSPFDLTGQTLVFVPGLDPGPTPSLDGGPPPPAANEVPIPLGDDDTKSIPLGFAFPYYGSAYSSVFVNSDGNLTFGAGDGQSGLPRSVERFLSGPPRIAVLYGDLNPAAGGSVSYRHDTPQSTTITYSGVPTYGGGGGNTARVTLDAWGDISIKIAAVSSSIWVVGVAQGGAGNQGTAMDLSDQIGEPLPYLGPGAVFETFTGQPFDLVGAPVLFAR